MSRFLRDYRTARWLPWLVFLIGLSASIWLWQQLATKEIDHIQTLVLAEVQAVEHELQSWVDVQLHTLQRRAWERAEYGPDTQQRWEATVRYDMKLFAGMEAVVWFDDELRPRWHASRNEDHQVTAQLLTHPDESRSLNRAKQRQAFTTAKVPLSDSQLSRFVINVPIKGGGTIVGVFRIDELMKKVMDDNSPDLMIQLRDNGTPVFQNVPGQFGRDYTVQHSLNVLGNSWTLAACPTAVFLKREHSKAVGLTMVVGAGVSWLLSLVVGLAIRTHLDKLAIERQKSKLAHFSSIVSNCQDAIISTTKEGVIVSWNTAAEVLFGYRRDEVLDKHISILDGPDRDPHEVERLRRVCRGEWVDAFDTLRKRKDGTLVDISLNESPVTDETGQIIGVSNISRDVTERIEAHRQLAHFSSIIATCQDAIVSTLTSGNVLSWNHSAELMFGYRADEVLGKHISLLDPPTRNANEDQLFQQVCDGSWVDPFDTRRRCKDGRLLDVSLNESPISCDGEIVGVSAIYRDITDRRRVQRQLEENASLLKAVNDSLNESYAKAEAATRAKSEFLANMSHEIRTPMTAILGFADVLADRSDLNDEMRDATETIKRNGEYLLQIINDILDLSKIEAEKMVVENLPTDVTRVLNDVERLMQVRARAKTVILKIRYCSKLPQTISTDAIRLKQVLVNLVGNAIKFSDKGSVEIRVAFDATTHRLTIEIRDDGIGMSEEQLSRLFTPFTQADATTTRKFGGTGLGLTISQRLVGLLGGRIEVESELNEGSVFRVVFDLEAGQYDELVDGERHGRSIAKPKQSTELPALNCRILLAEDGKDNQRLISFLLTRAGAKVSIVEDGKSAVDSAMGSIRGRRQGDPMKPFDIILMDIQMPIMDGYVATTRLRELGFTQPIIALTANAMAGDREKCLEAGCTDYTTKPIHRETLISMISRYVSTSDAVGTST